MRMNQASTMNLRLQRLEVHRCHVIALLEIRAGNALDGNAHWQMLLVRLLGQFGIIMPCPDHGLV